MKTLLVLVLLAFVVLTQRPGSVSLCLILESRWFQTDRKGSINSNAKRRSLEDSHRESQNWILAKTQWKPWKCVKRLRTDCVRNYLQNRVQLRIRPRPNHCLLPSLDQHIRCHWNQVFSRRKLTSSAYLLLIHLLKYFL